MLQDKYLAHNTGHDQPTHFYLSQDCQVRGTCLCNLLSLRSWISSSSVLSSRVASSTYQQSGVYKNSSAYQTATLLGISSFSVTNVRQDAPHEPGCSKVESNPRQARDNRHETLIRKREQGGFQKTMLLCFVCYKNINMRSKRVITNIENYNCRSS